MRLTCPNCGARYEVPEEVIPPEGRDVQCSSCGSTWFQAHPDQLAPEEFEEDAPPPDSAWEPVVDEPANAEVHGFDDAPQGEETLENVVKQMVERTVPQQVEEAVADAVETELQSDAAPADIPDFEAALDADLAREAEEIAEAETQEEEPRLVASPARRRRPIDPEVANVLREEAQHEAEARRAEAEQLETQPELGLAEPQEDDAARRAREARARMARIRGRSEKEATVQSEAAIPANSRRGLLPDIEEINSTLRSTEDRTPAEIPDGRPTTRQRRAGGNRIGLALSILLFAAGFLVYMKPEEVTNRVEGSETYVSAYINFVDDGRLWLDRQMTQAMLWLDGVASSLSSDESNTADS